MKHIGIVCEGPTVCENWSKVTKLCQSARDFEESILALMESGAV